MVEEYRKEAKEYKKECEKAKKESWKVYVEGVSSENAANKLRKVLERRERRALGLMDRPDGTITDPGKGTINYMLESHFPTATECSAKTYREESFRKNTTRLTG